MAKANSKKLHLSPKLSDEIFAFDEKGDDVNVPISAIEVLLDKASSGITNKFTYSDTDIEEGTFNADSENYSEVTTLTFSNTDKNSLLLLDYFELLDANKVDIFLELREVGFESSAFFIISNVVYNEDDTTTFTVSLNGSFERGNLILNNQYTIGLSMSYQQSKIDEINAELNKKLRIDSVVALSESKQKNALENIGLIRGKSESNIKGKYIISSNFDFTFPVEGVNYSNCELEIISNFNFGNTTVTLPENITLKFNGGKFSGGTIIGNNTKIETNSDHIFESDLILEGTWDIDEVKSEWFGLLADGTEESSLLEKSMVFTSITKGLSLKLPYGKSYLIDTPITSKPINIDFNFSTIYIDDIGEDAITLKNEDEGLVGSESLLTSSVPESTMLLNIATDIGLEIGDIIHIKSDEVYYDRDVVTLTPPRIYLMGEIAKVKDISDGGLSIRLTSPIEGTYKMSENACIQKMNMAKPIVVKNGFFKNQNPDDQTSSTMIGLNLFYIDNPIIENLVFENIRKASLYITRCFNTFISKVVASGSSLDALGYSIVIQDSSSTFIDNCKLTSSRHAITTGTTYGSAFLTANVNITNCYLSCQTPRYASEEHGSAGVVVFHNNLLRAIIENNVFQSSFDATYTFTDYDAGVTYNVDDKVYHDGEYFISYANGNTGNTPVNINPTHWRSYFSDFYALIQPVGNLVFKNNIVRGFKIAILSDVKDTSQPVPFSNMVIDGNVFINNDTCIEYASSNDKSSLEVLSNDYLIERKKYLTNSTVFKINASTYYNNLFIKGGYIRNYVTGFTVINYDADFVVSDITMINDIELKANSSSAFFKSTNPTLAGNNYHFSNIKTINLARAFEIRADAVTKLKGTNLVIKNSTTFLITYGNIANISLSNIDVEDCIYFIHLGYNTNTVTDLILKGSDVDTDEFQYGNVTNYTNYANTYSGKVPVIGGVTKTMDFTTS